MQTTYFNKIKELDDLTGYVSIALYFPSWWRRKMQKASELAPSHTMLKRGYTHEDYVQLLKNRKLTPQKVYAKYKSCTLVCHEKNPTTCHRTMLIRWLSEELELEKPIEEMA